MKTVVQINSVCNGSTGKIMGDIARKINNRDSEAICFYGRRKGYSDIKCERITSNISFFIHVICTFLFNNHGMYSYFATKRLVKKLRKINPDVIQLHNIHGYYLNYKVLFKYLKNEYKGKIYWTLHDCLSFTGHCPYFDYVKCDKWMTCCNNCVQYKSYPYSWFFDTSKTEYLRKKELFTGLDNLELIVPSKWLARLVKKSYLNYKINIIENGIDLNKFKYTYDAKIYKKYNIDKNKKIILGVANVWEKRKGLDDFIKLSKDLPQNTQIVLVGLTKKQIKALPSNIIGIERTDNQLELIKIYSIADLFISASKEETFGLVIGEAICSGTPALTYDVCACKEQIVGNVGYTCKNYSELLNKINDCIKKDYKHTIFNNSKYLKRFNSIDKYNEYLKLYGVLK